MSLRYVRHPTGQTTIGICGPSRNVSARYFRQRRVRHAPVYAGAYKNLANYSRKSNYVSFCGATGSSAQRRKEEIESAPILSSNNLLSSLFLRDSLILSCFEKKKTPADWKTSYFPSSTSPINRHWWSGLGLGRGNKCVNPPLSIIEGGI